MLIRIGPVVLNTDTIAYVIDEHTPRALHTANQRSQIEIHCSNGEMFPINDQEGKDAFRLTYYGALGEPVNIFETKFVSMPSTTLRKVNVPTETYAPPMFSAPQRSKVQSIDEGVPKLNLDRIRNPVKTP